MAFAIAAGGARSRAARPRPSSRVWAPVGVRRVDELDQDRRRVRRGRQFVVEQVRVLLELPPSSWNEPSLRAIPRPWTTPPSTWPSAPAGFSTRPKSCTAAYDFTATQETGLAVDPDPGGMGEEGRRRERAEDAIRPTQPLASCSGRSGADGPEPRPSRSYRCVRLLGESAGIETLRCGGPDNPGAPRPRARDRRGLLLELLGGEVEQLPSNLSRGRDHRTPVVEGGLASRAADVPGTSVGVLVDNLEAREASMPGSSAARSGRAMTAPLPFSCAPVTITPVPSGLRVRYAPDGDGIGEPPAAGKADRLTLGSSRPRYRRSARPRARGSAWAPIRGRRPARVGPSSPSSARFLSRKS